jgi:formylglycine-generating enzyme required for sulfatase activity
MTNGAVGALTIKGRAAPPGMFPIPDGTFFMGSDKHYPEEAPAHRVRIDEFWMDATPVTNRWFREFVEPAGNVNIESFKEFPPRAKAARFTVSDVMEKITAGAASKD